ncbi:prepilin-type N-terminal cleavage/methylation domain-containing protein [bacterium]|nr:prepilin-type N-terminal cleavage/methylation domain-containing protein [bacterium]
MSFLRRWVKILNKKGFTLVEMLAVIAILALVMSLCVMGVVKVRNNALEKMLENKMNDLVGSAVLLGQQSEDLEEVCNVDGEVYNYCKIVTVKDLIEQKYYSSNMDLKNDVTNNSMLCDKLIVFRKNNRMNAKFINVYSNTENKTC